MSAIDGLGSSMNMMYAMGMQRPNQQQMSSKVDTDGSGKVDQTELTAFADGLYEKTGIEINTEEALSSYDTDGDGGLSEEEMLAMMSSYMSPPPIMGSDGQSQATGRMSGSLSRPDKQEMFNTIDTDGSGTIDETELASFIEQLAEDTGITMDAENALSTYDADGDGSLSHEEMDTMMAANRPSAPPAKVIDAYSQNSDDDENDKISQLLSLFSNSDDEEQNMLKMASYMPVNITA
ncbi:MAG: EF-hand domain-containing protein [Deltaproteobacteria bacterium]|nr:EF-hand domain-containing protein [Deltaproteobacteria bacterium]